MEKIPVRAPGPLARLSGKSHGNNNAHEKHTLHVKLIEDLARKGPCDRREVEPLDHLRRYEACNKKELYRGPVSLYRIREDFGMQFLLRSTPLCPFLYKHGDPPGNYFGGADRLV